MTARKRVVITAMTTINPLGSTLDEYYDNLVAGRSGIRFWESLDLGAIECRVGGDLGMYDFGAALENLRTIITEPLFKKTRKLFNSTTFSTKMTLLCALRAYVDAGLFASAPDPFRGSVALGGHNINSRYIEKNILQFAKEPDYIDPLLGVEALDPNIAGCVSELLQLNGATLSVGGACASGNLALREGFRNITGGESDVAVVVAAPFDLTRLDIHASVFLQAMVTDPGLQEDPTRASRPFDTGRNGFIPSHGAAAVVLEELEHARGREAPIHAELLGVIANSNACHLPTPAGRFQAYLIKQLLDATGTPPEAVDYVNCHATSTPMGDLEEIRAVKEAFGGHAYSMKLNAPKSMLGHTCWAAPLVETIGAVLQMQRGRLHPTINVDRLDPEIDLDVCANAAVDHHVEYLLKNSFGFGGINCCSLIRRYGE